MYAYNMTYICVCIWHIAYAYNQECIIGECQASRECQTAVEAMKNELEKSFQMHFHMNTISVKGGMWCIGSLITFCRLWNDVLHVT